MNSLRRGFLTSRDFRRSIPLYFLMLPGILVTLLFAYGPMYGVQIAFKEFAYRKGIWGSPWVGLKHFVRYINYPGFWIIFRNTLVLSLYGMIGFPINLLFALFLNEMNHLKFKKVVQMVSYAPHFLSTVVVCGMLMLFLNRENGLFNNVLTALGGRRINFLAEPSLFPGIYVWSGVWQDLGWGTIIYLSALSGVSTDMVEAARLDGANRLQIMFRINLPTIMPTVMILLIMSLGHVLSVGFDKVLLLQNNLNLDTSRVISTYVYEIGLVDGQMSYSAAIGLFNNVVNLIVLVLVNGVAKRLSGVGLW